ncbi:MAG: DUF3179 domain-containing protein [Acidimicrobiia bacterium]
MRIVMVLSLLAVSCSAGGTEGVAFETFGVLPAGPSALDDPEHPDLPTPTIPPADLVSGGPPPDGIPSIDEPRFRSIADAELSLADTEPVIVVDIEGDVRAYPIEILIWHEIVNDVVGGVPVAVTYCPLCNSAVTFERRINGVDVTFGTSGQLYASALVMYDRETESLWTHFDGRAIAGVLAGHRLEPVPSPLLAWSEFKKAHPEGQVLSRETGFDRQYGRNPYYGYDNPDTRPRFLRGEVDDRARVKQRVVGISVDGAAVAFPLEEVSGGEAKVTSATVGEMPVAVFWVAGQNSALEDADTSKGRDVGSVGVFRPEADGRALSFRAEGPTFVDAETSSTWNITGRAISGSLEGARLVAVPHLDTFWFAWSTYQPETTLFGS